MVPTDAAMPASACERTCCTAAAPLLSEVVRSPAADTTACPTDSLVGSAA